MKLINYLIILIFLNNCSFDNKSGIWKNESQISIKKIDLPRIFKKFNHQEKNLIKLLILTRNMFLKKIV